MQRCLTIEKCYLQEDPNANGTAAIGPGGDRHGGNGTAYGPGADLDAIGHGRATNGSDTNRQGQPRPHLPRTQVNTIRAPF